MKTIKELSAYVKQIKSTLKKFDYPYYKMKVTRKKITIKAHFEDIDWIANGIYTSCSFNKIEINISSIEIIL